MNNAIEEGKVDAKGNVIQDDKQKPDPIDKAIQSRMKGGSLTNVVQSKDKKGDDEIVFKLKIKGGQPKIGEARKDPAAAMANAAAEKEAEQAKLVKTPCIIDVSLGERLKAGAYTSTTQGSSKDKSQEVVFKLKLKGDMPVLAEAKSDPSMIAKNSDGAPVAPEKKTKSKPCEIDASLQERIVEGSITSTVRNGGASSNTDEVFSLKQTGEILQPSAKSPTEVAAE